MSFYIYTLGDAGFLQNVFLSVGSVFGPAHEDAYSSALKIGMLIGVFIIVGKGLINSGRGLQPGHFILSIVLYGVMFAPKTEVYIEDVYSGRVYTVDDVPMGIAAVASIFSTMGITITKWNDQAFSLPHSGSGLSSDGYLNGLDMITGSRRFLANPLMYSSANTGAGDFSKSWSQYIQECTMPGLDRGAIDIKTLSSSGNILEALKFESEVYFTEVIVSGGPVIQNCTDAHATLSNYTNTFLDNAREAMVHVVLGTANAATSTGVDVENKLQDALAYIGQSSVSARQFMTSSLLIPIFENSAAGKYLNDLQFTAASMVNLAIQQRNVQWAAEQDVFKTTFRPIYTFVEGMVYAITPLMAILVVMGPFGISLVGKHLIALIWIQLWMPLLAFANMYIYVSATGTMSAFIDKTGNDLTSFAGLGSLDMYIDTWISTGSYMAASAPALAGFLVYGSSVALTNIAQRIQGSDTINEKMLAPDISNAPSMVSQASEWGYNKVEGLNSPHAKDYNPGLNLNQGFASSISSAREDMKQAQEQHSAARQAGFQQMQSEVKSASDVVSLGRQLMSGTSDVAQTVQKQVSQLQKGHQFSEEQSSALAGMLGLSASYGFGGEGKQHLSNIAGKQVDDETDLFDLVAQFTGEKRPERLLPGKAEGKGKKGGKQSNIDLPGSGRVSGDARGTKMNQTVDRAQDSLSMSDMRDVAQANNFSAKLDESMAADSRNATTESWEQRFGVSNAKNLGVSQSKMQSASDRINKMEQSSSAISSAMDLNGVAAPTLLAPYANELKEAAFAVGGGKIFSDRERLNSQLYQDSNKSAAASAIFALSQMNRMDKLSDVVDKALGTSYGDINPQRNAGLSENRAGLVANADRAQEEAITATSDNSGIQTAQGTASRVEQMIPAVDQSVGREGSRIPTSSSNSSGPTSGQRNAPDNQGESSKPSYWGQEAATGSNGNMSTGQSSGFGPSISSGIQNQFENKFSADRSTAANRGSQQLTDINSKQASAMRQQIMSADIPTTSMAHVGYALLAGGAVDEMKQTEAWAFMRSLDKTATTQYAKAAQSAEEFGNLVEKNPQIAGPLTEVLSQGGAALDSFWGWAKSGFDGDYLLDDNFQKSYAEKINGMQGGYAQKIDQSVGMFMMAANTALDSGEFQGTVSEVADQLMDELYYSPRNIARQEASNAGLNGLEQDIFAEATVAGIGGQIGSSDKKDQLRQQYRVSHNDWEQDQEFIDKKFDNIWDAASAGDNARHFLNQIEAYNEATSGPSREEQGFLKGQL